MLKQFKRTHQRNANRNQQDFNCTEKDINIEGLIGPKLLWATFSGGGFSKEGLQPSRNGLQPTSDGLEPSSAGLRRVRGE